MRSTPYPDDGGDVMPGSETPNAPSTSVGSEPAGRLTRLRSLVEDGTRTVAHRIDELRAAFPPFDIGLTAVERDGQIGGFVLAGATAFRLFVYLLPLYLLVLVALGAAFAFDPSSPDDMAGSVGVSNFVVDMLSDASSRSNKSLWILLPVTLYALVSAGRSAHKVIATAHARAWGITPTPKAKAWAAAGGFLLTSLVIAGALTTVRHFRTGALVPFVMVAAGAFYSGLWLVISRWLPRAEGTDTRALIPGALMVGIGTQGLFLFSVLYLNRKIESAAAAYGALGIAASSLLWLYLLGRLVVAAPVLNATMWERRAGVAQPAIPPPSESTEPNP